MTLTEVSKMTYNLTIAGYVNGLKFKSAGELKKSMEKWLSKDTDSYICELVLPDGRWFCRLIRRGNYYDLYVPDTREQENQIMNELLGVIREWEVYK